MVACIREGDVLGVRRLLRDGADPDGDYTAGLLQISPSHSISTDRWSALHHAAFHGQRECAEQLLAVGARVDAEGRFEGTPLKLAAMQGHAELVALLLVHGADPARGMLGATAHVDCLRLLVAAGADPAVSVPGAIIYDHVESLRYLLESGASAAGRAGMAVTKDGKIIGTPRMMALDYGRRACYALLRGRPPYRAFSDAVADGNVAVAEEMLAAGASIHELDTYGRSPVYWALLAADVEMLRWLLERGADLARVGAHAALRSRSVEVLALVHAHGATWKGALTEAVAMDHEPVLRWLLAHVSFSEDERRSAAWRCAANDRDDALRVLHAHDIEGTGTLATAALYGSARVIELLLARGEDPRGLHHGKTLLDLVLEGPAPEVTYELDEADLETPLVQRLRALGVKSRYLPDDLA